MSTSAWQLKGTEARLQRGPLSATLDLLRPQAGLTGLSIDDAAWEGLGALALDLPSNDAGASPLGEGYVRGEDLVVSYQESPEWPVRVDAVWRAVDSGVRGPAPAAVDLIVSVRTSVPSARLELAVRTVVCADEILRLADAAGPGFDRISLGVGGCVVLEPGAGPGCVVFRTTAVGGPAFGYAEMIHPADFHDDRLTALAERRMIQWRHRLFPEDLEKGVILRARVRGVLVPRDDDLASAARCYAAFAAAEPPLGT